MNDSTVLSQMSASYAPMAQGVQHQWVNPLQGMPLIGHGGMGGMAGMFMTPQINRAFGSVGMAPMGIGHDQNVYDQMMRQRYSQAQMEAMRVASESDREAIFRSMRGMAAVTGTPFGAEQRRAAHAMAGQISGAAGMLAPMMPELFDSLGGARGSAALMANRMMDAGRYRLDAATGRMGMSAESIGGMAQNIMGDMYSDRNIGQMQGITAGQMGGMFQQLQARGMIAGYASQAPLSGYGGSSDFRAHALRAIDSTLAGGDKGFRDRAMSQGVDLKGGAQGLSASDLDKLQMDPSVADKLRSFDVERVKRSLKAYTGAVAAMRDIFGDMGRPNAPMSELISGLEAMTGGASSQLDSSRLGSMARQTHNLARQTGIGMDNAMMLQQHASVRAQQMGIEPIFGMQAAQGAMGFGGAYRAQGHAAHTAWGAMNADQVQQLDANLRVQAMASGMTNRMAVAMRIADTAGGFDPNSTAGRYVAAIRGGLNQYKDDSGNLSTVNLSDTEFTRMLSGAKRGGKSAGISEGDVQSMLGETEANREYSERYRLGDITRRAQGTDELHPFVGNRLHDTLYQRLRDQLVRQGVGDDEANRRASEAAGAVSQRATKRIFGMSTEQFAGTETRNRGISEILQGELASTGILSGMSEGDQQSFLRQTSEQFYGNANRALQGSQYRAFGNLQNVHRLTNQATLDEADRQQTQARFTGEMQEALAPLGRGSMLSRAFEALQNARADDPAAMQKVLAEALGGIKHDDINKAMMPAFQKLLERRKAVEDMQAKIAKEQNPEQRASLMNQLATLHRELSGEARDVAVMGEQHGMFTQDSVTHEDLTRAESSSRTLMTAQQDITGLRGNFGGDVTDAQIKAMRSGREGTRATMTEAAAVLLARQARTGDKNLGNIPKADLLAMTKNLKFEDDSEARALIRSQRRMTPMRASEEEITAVMAENKGMTREQAKDLANARLRAARLGVDESEVKAVMEKEGLSESDAIGKVFANKAESGWEVNDEDRTEFKAAAGYVDPTSAQIQRFRERTGTEGDDATVKGAMLDKAVLTRRQQEAQARFGAFWGSSEGSAFRDATTQATQDAENLAVRLVQTPAMVQRMGTRALEMREQLTTGRQRLRELAMYHAGGNMARLMAGDLNIDMSTAAGRATAARVKGEVAGIQYGERGIIGEIQEQEGKPGRQFGNADEEAKRIAKLAGITDPEKIKQLGYDVGLLGKMTPEQEAQVRAYDDTRKTISDRAALRGVDESYLKDAAEGTYGEFDDDERADLRRLFSREAEQREGVGKVAESFGLKSIADLQGVTKVSRLLSSLTQSALKDEDEDPRTMAQRIYSEYGMSGKGEKLAMNLQTTMGRGMGRAMIETSQRLKKAAEGKGTVKDMADKYLSAITAGGDKIGEFQKTYGFDMAKDGQRWDRFQKDMQFQQQFGLMASRDKGEDAFEKTANKVLTGEFGRTTKDETRDAVGGGGGRMQLSGTVKIEGDQMYMDQVWGDGLRFGASR